MGSSNTNIALAPPKDRRDFFLSGQSFEVQLAAREDLPLISGGRQFCPETQELRKLRAHARKTVFDTLQHHPRLILHPLAPGGLSFLDLWPHQMNFLEDVI